MSLLREFPIVDQTNLFRIIEGCSWIIADPSGRAVCDRLVAWIVV
jgi:hypothetical protein